MLCSPFSFLWLVMSRLFEHCAYSLNVTQEGTDVNGFCANGQPMKIM